MTASGHRPVCVLGVGRSGTSLTARALNVLGVDLGPEETMLQPDDVPPGAPDNPKGFWEQREIVQLNQEVLGSLGAGYQEISRRRVGWETAVELEPFRARIAELVERCFDGRRWGFKHPQTTLTLPLWRSVVGEFDHVVCVRNPLEVIASVGDGPAASRGDLIGIWTHFTCEALRLTAGRRRMFVFYEDWSTDPHAVGRELARFVHGSPDAEAASRVASVFDPQLHRQCAGELEFAERDDMPLAPRALHFLVRDLAAAERRGEARASALQAVAARMDGGPAQAAA